MNEKQQELLDKVKGLTVENIDMQDADYLHIYFEGGLRLRIETYADPYDPFNMLTDLFLEEQRGLYAHYHPIEVYDALDYESDKSDIPDDEKEF